MRIDRLLFFLRLMKSRTQAQALVEQGHVRIDGKRATKPSDEVRAGAVLSLPLHGAVRIVRVATLPARRGPPAEARGHYEELPANVSHQGAGD